MKEKNLLASVALFSELYNSETYHSIFDILAEFIKSALIIERKFSFTSTEVKTLLEKTFGFVIPEPVLRTTLNNKLKEVVTRKDGLYHLEKPIDADTTKIQSEFNFINFSHDSILRTLEIFIEQKTASKLSDTDKKLVFDNFNQFLLDNGYSEKYSDLISAFIILNQNNSEFYNTLSAIREGLIMYQGIIYTPDINELGKWNSDLVLYLNTEILFSALGYNGVLFQEIFKDFYKLVNEINQSSPSTKGRRIELKYLEETKAEIDNFFTTAESIKRGHIKLDPTKSAMKSIVDSCSTVSEIKAKKVRFELEIKRMGISIQEFNHQWDSIQKYNIEDEQVLEKLRKDSIEKNKFFDEDTCLQYFRIFTKINYFRKGDNNRPIEKIGHLFITENNFAKYLAHNSVVKFSGNDISFAKDIDYITTRFWFRLKKGFADKQSLPKSFDVVTKAKIILSSHVNMSVSNGYYKLIQELKNGKLTQEEALELTQEYREKPTKPEEITIENIDSSLDFLNDDSYMENIFREKERKDELLVEQKNRIADLEAEITRRDEVKRNESAKKDGIKAANERKVLIQNSLKRSIRTLKGDIKYALLVFIPEVIIFIVSFWLKEIPSFKTFITNLGDHQYVFWLILSVLLGLIVYARSHLYNKEKIKRGFRGILIIITFKLTSYKEQQIEILEKEYFVEI